MALYFKFKKKEKSNSCMKLRDIFFKLANNLQQIPNKQYSNVQQFILQILTSH
jgi:hypothetical protein